MKMYPYRFLVLIVLTMFLNVLAVFGQETAGKKSNTQVEVINPKDSPVIVTLLGVYDNEYHPGIQNVKFTVQNISAKRIAKVGANLEFESFKDSSTTVTWFDFLPGKTMEMGLQLNSAHANYKRGDKFTLVMDYILFSDRTTWGPDTGKRGEFESGAYAGEKFCFEQVNELIKNNNKEQLHELLRILAIGKSSTIPLEMDKTRSEKWQSGYSSGYSTALYLIAPKDASHNKIALPAIADFHLDKFALNVTKVEKQQAIYFDAQK